ncbi:MAG: YicC/YloC family endoribonuclease [Planctomycetota bacterium]
MLLSMTGHGEARVAAENCVATVQVRAVNGRYLKVVLRGYEFAPSAEARIEALTRKSVKRGNVSINVRLERTSGSGLYTIRPDALQRYVHQLAATDLGFDMSNQVGALLQLPGVVEPAHESAELQTEETQTIDQAVNDALRDLDRMRTEEGTAMAADLAAKLEAVRAAVDAIKGRAPEVVSGYRERLKERVNAFLSENNVSVADHDFLREVGIFADRCDISEETVRLESHLDQFAKAMESAQSEGRKLEFIIQEMFRETNTIGSKANDAEIASWVVEIKNNIERMREMVQNIE